jgi:hypothetical protein
MAHWAMYADGADGRCSCVTVPDPRDPMPNNLAPAPSAGAERTRRYRARRRQGDVLVTLTVSGEVIERLVARDWLDAAEAADPAALRDLLHELLRIIGEDAPEPP